MCNPQFSTNLAGITTPILILFIGCSGNNANIRNLSQSDSKATKKELIDNWSDYHISLRTTAIVFDPKNDGRRILLGGKKGWYWGKIKDTQSISYTKPSFLTSPHPLLTPTSKSGYKLHTKFRPPRKIGELIQKCTN